MPLRLELKPDERARFFAAFTDEAAFFRYLDENRQLGRTPRVTTMSRKALARRMAIVYAA